MNEKFKDFQIEEYKNISTAHFETDLNGYLTSNNTSNSSDMIELGESLYSNYADGAELGEYIQNFLEGQYIDVLELEITPQNIIFSLIEEEDYNI